MVFTNKFKDVMDTLRKLIMDYIEKMPPGGIAFVSEIRTAVNEYAKMKNIQGQIEDNRTVDKILNQLIHESAVGALKKDKHGDLFIKATPVVVKSAVSEVCRPHVVTAVVTTGGSSIIPMRTVNEYLIVDRTYDTSLLQSSCATLNAIPPTCGTIAVQGGTIVAKNFFDTHYL